MTRSMKLLILALSLLCLAGCSSVIKLKKIDPLGSHVEYIPLLDSDGDISRHTENYLRANLLLELYKRSPDELIALLDARFRERPYRETLTILADLCYWRGRRCGDRDRAANYFLSTAAYAYTYLLDDQIFPRETGWLDPMGFVMSRYYNNSVLLLFEYLRSLELLDKSGYVLGDALGRKYAFRPFVNQLPLPLEKFREIIPCANFLPQNVLGFSHRFGLGVPMLAVLDETCDWNGVKFLADQTFATTFFLRLGGGEQEGEFTAGLEAYDTLRISEISLGDRTVPLELDFTTPVVYMMRPPGLWENLYYMLNPGKQKEKETLALLTPYDGKKIPVLLVHGLMSDPRTWAQMLNSLLGDERLRAHYQFWSFSYSTGLPVLYSAHLLRTSLREAVDRLDPERTNPNLNKMVIICHSMGGLLSKTTIQDAPPDFGDNLSDRDTRELLKELDEETRARLAAMLEFRRMEFISRVIFVAVPHRGSELATSSLAVLGAYLVTLPGELVDLGSNVLRTLNIVDTDPAFRLANGISNLSPNNKVLIELEKIPLPPEVPYHSIIGNRKAAGVPGGSDGIVPYSSSHLEGARSEIVVQSNHSVQRTATAIEEIRNILLQHLRENGLELINE